MKRLLFIMFVALFVAAVRAQEQPRRALFTEFAGASGLVGVSFDSRLKSSTHWGYRVGLSYNMGMGTSPKDEPSVLYSGPSILVASNYLIGRGNHRLELGLGMAFGYFCKEDNADAPLGSSGWNNNRCWEMGYYHFGEVGYRYQPARGFFLRMGVALNFVFERKVGLQWPFSLPYLGCGFAF